MINKTGIIYDKDLPFSCLLLYHTPAQSFFKINNSIIKFGHFMTSRKNSFNDCDYYERVKKAGYKTIVSRNSWIWHKGGASTSRNPDCQNPVYYKIFQEKHG
jgi:hypothetical protein